MKSAPLLVAGALVLGVAMANFATAAEPTVVAPVAAVDAPLKAGPMQTAVFAGGCFWGVEAVFEHVAGVQSVRSGYAGGSALTAHYEVVGSGLTGHAESIEVKFDPAKVSYGMLLRVFFSVAHNPMELNHQGPDSGSQYRSTVFAQSPDQAKLARAYIAQLGAAKVWPGKIVTTIETGKAFYPAEAYHQNFLKLNPDYPYIVVNDAPKLVAFKARLPKLWSEKAVG